MRVWAAARVARLLAVRPSHLRWHEADVASCATELTKRRIRSTKPCAPCASRDSPPHGGGRMGGRGAL